MPVLLRTIAVSALLSLAVLTSAASAAPRLIALGTGANVNVLFSFDADNPGATSAVPVTGLGSSSLVGIDRRPVDGLLYGLGVNGNVATVFGIEPATGTASSLGSATVNSITAATAYGIDFNPVSDRIRVVNDLGSGIGNNVNNFRLRTDGSIAGIDTDLDFSAAPGSGSEVAIAHDRSVAGATATTLFGITAIGDQLVRQGGVDGVPSPNGGAIVPIGPLGIDITSNAGFDIDPTTGEAFAAFTSAGTSGLYRIDLTTGAATSIGKIGNGTIAFGGLTIVPPPVALAPPPPAEPKLETLRLRPRTFRTANIGGAILSRARKAPVGTTVSYTVSLAATVTFTVERRSVGRRVGKACRKQTRANRDRKPCPRFKPLKGSFSHVGAAGGNSFRFTGRIGGRALKPGGFRLVARAGASSQRVRFTIAAPGA